MSAKVQAGSGPRPAAQPKLLLLWLANRATDAGCAFQPSASSQAHGLSERMVRYHLEALARDRDDQGDPRAPVLSIIERRVAADRKHSKCTCCAFHGPCPTWSAPSSTN